MKGMKAGKYQIECMLDNYSIVNAEVMFLFHNNRDVMESEHVYSDIWSRG